MSVFRIICIVVCFLLGCMLAGCRTDNSVKVVTDITPQGDVTWHTEYKVQW